jgi:hypothetical protein
MKSTAKTAKFLMVLFAIILGIVIVVNLFYPDMFPQLEGFKEGNVTQQKQVCNATTCGSSIAAIDKWFAGKKIEDTKGFVTNGAVKLSPTFPAEFKLSKSDKKCNNYIECKVNALTKESSKTNSESTTTTSTTSPTSGGSGDTKALLVETNNLLETAIAKL